MLNRRSSPVRGFTLIELMVVVTIIALLATMVTINVLAQRDRADRDKALMDVAQIHQAVTLFYLEERRVPTMQDLIDPPPHLDGYEEVPRDPWDHAYEIQPRDEPGSWEVLCLGPDGQAGTPDDISSRTLKDKRRPGRARNG